MLVPFPASGAMGTHGVADMAGDGANMVMLRNAKQHPVQATAQACTTSASKPVRRPGNAQHHPSREGKFCLHSVHALAWRARLG